LLILSLNRSVCDRWSIMSQKAMLEDSVILHNASTEQWLCFKSPHQIITAIRAEDVVSAIGRIEELVLQKRWYAAGFIAYEAASAFDPALVTHAAGDFPLIWFGLYSEPEIFTLPPPDFKAYSLGIPIPSISQTEYNNAIRMIKKYIGEGDTYQVNYTLRLQAAFSGDPWHLFLAMVRAQPAGYSACVNAGRFAICSASPELFFHLENNRLICKPMKGTVKRGRTLDEDEALSRWLHNSEKNRAENLMIVDMIRNDLGRVAEVGSVHVPYLFEVERHPTLWQMTSTVTAGCQKSLAEIFESLFPCASITGAPKIRTTQIISELEPTPRGIYTGCIGYISPDRFAQFNVAIRTAVVDRHKGQVEYGAGGGIVADSDSVDEYTEALLKARILTEQRPEFSLLETILWTPEDHYFLLEYHLRRIADSSAYFNYRIDLEYARKQLQEQITGFVQNPQRVRLLVNRDGSLEIQAAPIELTESHRPVRLGLAATPVHSSDIFLYHKTTHRQTYETALSDSPGYDDVLLWNERGELTESCRANVVLEISGNLLTPPVEAGLLAGTFRAKLIEQGKIQEHLLMVDDLKRCSKIYLINSVRKWQVAIMA
jgi:para-aminobenzoate synthetase / 4-amino-4-deoxychorismate lyase